LTDPQKNTVALDRQYRRVYCYYDATGRAKTY